MKWPWYRYSKKPFYTKIFRVLNCLLSTFSGIRCIEYVLDDIEIELEEVKMKLASYGDKTQ